MSKRPKPGVGQLELQIVWPVEPVTNDAAESTEDDRAEASGRLPATGSHQAPGRKWYSLIDKVYALPNLREAWAHVQANRGAAGVDEMTVGRFAEGAEERLRALSEDLRAKTYRPQPVRRVFIPKSGGGRRALGIPTVRDRVVQQALLQILGPIFEATFSRLSHGFRPGRGCASALSVVDRAVRHGYTWVVDADIEAFFDSVDHERLLDAVHESVTDGSVLKLLRHILEAGVVEAGVAEVEPSELGTPQGGPLSPLLANLYLHVLDERLGSAGYGLVRYADDFVIFTRSEDEAVSALAVAREVLEGELGLRLHPEKTRVMTVAAGFEFLGFHWYWDERRGCFRKEVRRKSAGRFREAIRALTPRLRGQRRPTERSLRRRLRRLGENPRLRRMLTRLNRYLRGWHWYFKDVWSPYPETSFAAFDSYVRMRVRLALVGRPGSGWWHRVLTNGVLRDLGLEGLDELQKRWREGVLTAPVRKDGSGGEPYARNPHVRFGEAGRGLSPP